MIQFCAIKFIFCEAKFKYVMTKLILFDKTQNEYKIEFCFCRTEVNIGKKEFSKYLAHAGVGTLIFGMDVENVCVFENK